METLSSATNEPAPLDLPPVKRAALPVAAILLLRPKQWAKNLLVFAAFLFTGSESFSNPHRIAFVLFGFMAMCFASSATYIFNDLADLERDRQHHKKRNRPLASGAVPKNLGIAMGVGLLAISLGIAWSMNKTSFSIVLIYLVLQVLYNWKLKRTPIADVYCIAVGFVLRAALGAAAITVSISAWLLFCTGALALMLGFAKRRNEFILQGDDRAASRESLVHYTKLSLDALVIMFATAAALCYGLYCIESTTAKKFPALILTSLFVFYGITRYVLLVFTADEGGEPADVLFRDKHIIASVVLFIAAAAFAVSGYSIPLLER